MYSCSLRLTFATSRSTASPLARPSPGSITSVAADPTMMPTLGTSGTLPSGITQVWSATFVVAPSRTIGSATGPRCAAAATTAARAKAATKAMRNDRIDVMRLPPPAAGDAGTPTGCHKRAVRTMARIARTADPARATVPDPRRGSIADDDRRTERARPLEGGSDGRLAEVVHGSGAGGRCRRVAPRRAVDVDLLLVVEEIERLEAEPHRHRLRAAPLGLEIQIQVILQSRHPLAAPRLVPVRHRRELLAGDRAEDTDRPALLVGQLRGGLADDAGDEIDRPDVLLVRHRVLQEVRAVEAGPAVQVGLDLAARERAAAEQARIDRLPALIVDEVAEQREVVAVIRVVAARLRVRVAGGRGPPVREALVDRELHALVGAFGRIDVGHHAVERAVRVERPDVIDEVAPRPLDVPDGPAEVPANLPLGADGELVHVAWRDCRVGLERVGARLGPAAEDVGRAVPDVGVVVLLLRHVRERVRIALEHAVVEPAVRADQQRLGIGRQRVAGRDARRQIGRIHRPHADVARPRLALDAQPDLEA